IHQNCAVRGLDIEAGKVTGVVTEKGRLRAGAVLAAGGAWTSMLLRHHGLRLAQAGVRSTSFFTQAAPPVVDGGLSMPDVTIRRRLDGGYTVGMRGRGRLELTPQGLLYARQFWPTFKVRRSLLKIGIGRSFFEGPESLARWTLDSVSPFERIRTLDPPPDQQLVQASLARLAANYPQLKDLKVAAS